MTVRLGTRGSALALAQAGRIRDAIQALGEPCELVVVTTQGDVSKASLAQIGGTGVFAGALRAALLAEEVDLVVHSLKDLPIDPAPGLVVAGVPVREDARDVLCARDGLDLAALPAGATVGTGSPRRHAQLIDRRDDLRVVDLRGNVDTRLGRVRDGALDAVVLSWAGLARLGRLDAATEVLDLESWPTAAGQGALALEVREADSDPATPIGAVIAKLTDPSARDAATAERRVLGLLEAGCAAPIGVASTVGEGSATLWASVHRPGGGRRLDRRRTVSFAADDRGAELAAAADALAAELLAAGAADLAPLGAQA
ncbi:hydroxymethylbilane synthase [Amnibacterium kyonggiense]|uniref:Hydroxymethylbilane synthase n=1 Tax=Amnibacterium kyonggiense TaxID=595671 RepID=A0A4V3EBB9_9MICO|nr:hydroxymethylbilane synthase [Amnibacterium kyonggiense]TDS79784.1 hydroxymethylbilane synthase [Amnibacterium kyonggiense]